MNLSEILNSINHNKENILRSRDDREEKSYAPFIINKSLSYFSDTIFLSNNMNAIPNVDKRMHYEYFLHSVRKRKRFSKCKRSNRMRDCRGSWSITRSLVRKAEEYLSLLTEDQINEIRDHTTFGDKKVKILHILFSMEVFNGTYRIICGRLG